MACALGVSLFVVPAAYSLLGTHLITKHQRDAEIEAILLPGAVLRRAGSRRVPVPPAIAPLPSRQIRATNRPLRLTE